MSALRYKSLLSATTSPHAAANMTGVNFCITTQVWNNRRYKVVGFNTATQRNPFSNELARAHSAYTSWRDGKLFHPLDAEREPCALTQFVHNNFRALVLNPQFPCLGARAALNNDCYRFGFYKEMNSPATTAGLAHDLWEFAHEQQSFGTDYATFVASFAAPIVADEFEWERLLWAQLQGLHELDQQHHEWDSHVSSDPEDPGFSFSFAEQGFFVVGLHPASSRLARRFSWATLVFNPHAQFERLRQRGRFDRMRETIRERDDKLQGSLNPNLSDFGERSEARQYSGRAVEEEWQCPFRARLRGAMDSES